MPLAKLSKRERDELASGEVVHCVPSMEEDMEYDAIQRAERRLIEGGAVGKGAEGLGGYFYNDEVVFTCDECAGDVSIQTMECAKCGVAFSI